MERPVRRSSPRRGAAYAGEQLQKSNRVTFKAGSDIRSDLPLQIYRRYILQMTFYLRRNPSNLYRMMLQEILVVRFINLSKYNN